jgi:hypothetical protein
MKWDGEGNTGIDGTLAAEFPIIGWSNRQVNLQLGINAAAFMGFSQDGELTFGLQTFDGLFAFPIDFYWKMLEIRAEWAHISAHYGDGIRNSSEKPTNLGSWSREFWQLQAGYDLGLLRPYMGFRVISHGTNSELPWGLQLGLEAAGPWLQTPYAAFDLQLAQENRLEPAMTLQLGAMATKEKTRFRIAFVWRQGPEDTGQLTGEQEYYLGLLLGFDRTGRFWYPMTPGKRFHNVSDRNALDPQGPP